jgi:pyruvate/2-oxoglutarate dehydrogenase complex dihydrolipoamide dehydrogenase (E3) component
MNDTHYDLIVLGLGPGGEEVAERMAEAGWSVLGVEQRLVGGECPYYGCIPSKMIVRGADALAEARRVNELAGSAVVTPDFAPVAKRIRDEATDNWDDRVAVERFESLGGTFVRGAGRLAGRNVDGKIPTARPLRRQARRDRSWCWAAGQSGSSSHRASPATARG